MAFPPGGITLPNVYRLLAHFKGVDPTETWRSEFSIFASGAVPQPGDAIINAAEAYWRDNLRTDCFLDHLELRKATWGDVIFSQQSALWTSTVGLAGTKIAAYGAQGANAVGKEVVCYVRITNSGPKPGKQFLRQLLDEGDIAAVPGSPWQFLTPPMTPNVTDAKFQTLLGTTGITGFFGAIPDPRLCVIHFSIKEFNINPANLPFESSVSAMHIVGPSTNKPTRKNKK